MISDEAQRIIDEQEDVLEPVKDSDAIRCGQGLKSEADLPSGVTLKRCKDCGLSVAYCVRVICNFSMRLIVL